MTLFEVLLSIFSFLEKNVPVVKPCSKSEGFCSSFVESAEAAVAATRAAATTTAAAVAVEKRVSH